MPLEDITPFLRIDKFPHIWCPGCGNGIILQAVIRTIYNLSLDKNNVAIVSGIGCSSRSAGYLDFNTLHTTHGRAISFATGIKLAKPSMNVIVLTGDGDCSTIGGNHLIHAARRNIDLTVVVFNNSIYGMTGGQFSATTGLDKNAATAPYGNIENSFDLCDLVKGAGATFIGRSTTFHATALPNLIKKGIENKGFSFIDVITACPIYYGRMNKFFDSTDMLKWQRDNAVNLKQWGIMSEEEKKGKFVIGELHNKPTLEYTERYKQLTEKITGKPIEIKEDVERCNEDNEEE